MAKKFLVSLAILLLISPTLKAQVSENFNDDDFSSNPVWTGDTSSFNINSAGQLQSKDTIQNHTFYLATVNHKSASTQWEFWARLAFNPSSENYIEAHLIALSPNPPDSNNTGYFVRCGNTEDNISLGKINVV